LLQIAQLFQPLERFQRTGRHRQIGRQRIGAIGIQADVVEHRHRIGVGCCKGDHFLGKIQRPPAGAEHRRRASHAPLGPVGAEHRQRLRITADHRRRHIDVGVGHRGHQGRHERRRGQRRVALQVHEHIRPQSGPAQGLGAAFGAVAAGIRRHDDVGAKSPGRVTDPVVVGQHMNGGHIGHRHRSLPRAPYQRLCHPVGSAQVDQRLAWIAG
jgi:hypothetical protein